MRILCAAHFQPDAWIIVVLQESASSSKKEQPVENPSPFDLFVVNCDLYYSQFRAHLPCLLDYRKL